MREYKVAKGWRIFIYVSYSLMLVLGIYCLTFLWHEFSVTLTVILIPISLGLVGLSVYALLDTYHWKLIIAQDRVIQRSLFQNRMLMLNEIRGFRAGQNYIHILPLNAERKKVNVSYFLGQRHEILLWLEQNFTNLDITEGDEEENRILKNYQFGVSEDKRKRRLREAKSAARIMNITGWILLIWLCFYPVPYYVAITVAGFFPLAIMAIGYRYLGMMKVDDEMHSNMPSMASGFAVSIVGFAWRAFKDFTLLHDQQFWIITSVVALILLIFYLLPLQPFRTVSHYVSAVAFYLLTFFYSFALFVFTNCMLDRSQPEIFKTPVIEKQISGDNRQTYKLTLKPWGEIHEPKEVEVSSGEYEYIALGDSVTVIQHFGYWRTPWIETVVE